MKVSRHKCGRPYHRKLHIDGEEWSWRVGGFNILVRSPDGKTTLNFDSYELYGSTQEEWYAGTSEDDWEMGGCEPVITPGEVKRFVEKWLRQTKGCKI